VLTMNSIKILHAVRSAIIATAELLVFVIRPSGFLSPINNQAECRLKSNKQKPQLTNEERQKSGSISNMQQQLDNISNRIQ